MDDNFSNPNIEWKKSGFGSSEKLSLKINPREAAAYNAKKKNAIQQASPLTASDLPAGLKKIRNKIKDVFDDDEDDEENVSVVIAPALMENNSLLRRKENSSPAGNISTNKNAARCRKARYVG